MFRKNIGYISAACFLLLSSTNTSAEGLLNNSYIGFSGGFASMSDADVSITDGVDTIGLANILEYDSGYTFAAFAGTSVHDNVRIQADLGYISSDFSGFSVPLPIEVTSGGLSGFYATGSVFFEAHLSEALTPYLGVGGGFFAPNVSDISVSDGGSTLDVPLKAADSVVPLIKLSAGTAYRISENLSVTADYSFLQSADFDIEIDPDPRAPTLVSDLTAHTFGVGLRYHF
ncbi:hypothetical protein E1162_08320 [Rhodobacteraceae bacterium RKSG542]|uniref:outer membrane protein n=1 Tax=Pseudovibrio flavus TaxID=2529854 RepID=UPI0012BB4F78|nr:outer membrane beta-barrel protein [Pseudovibrio flavus]MTI17246.1 hypothetical protein [Pseudovibrio flavus]